MLCWRCTKPIAEREVKIGFRASCPHCDVDLHVCKNCRYYSVGKPNDCIVPSTEFIRDREAANLCEDFKPLVQTLSSPSGDLARKLLGEPENRRDFNSLFDPDS